MDERFTGRGEGPGTATGSVEDTPLPSRPERRRRSEVWSSLSGGEKVVGEALQTSYAPELEALQARYDEAFEALREAASGYSAGANEGAAKAVLQEAAKSTQALRSEAKALVKSG